MLRRIALPVLLAVAAAVCGAQTNTDSAEKKVVLGKLGQSIKATPIYASASSRSRIFYRLKPYEYLVLSESNSKTYAKVLLKNGWYGYVRRDAVAKLPYDVTQNVNASTAPAVPPMGTRDTGSGSARAAAANYGLKFIGTPYKWGGNDPLNGIDCSAFVKFLNGKIGVNLPRTAAQQAHVGTPITRLEHLQAGDRLYFWDHKRGKIGHTGMYLGNGYFVHASGGKGQVTTDYLGKPNWLKILVSARR